MPNSLIVCENCFSDKELKAFIGNSQNTCDCEICGSKETRYIDITELKDFFLELFDCFSQDERGESLIDILQRDWSFFQNHDVGSKVLNLLISNWGLDFSNSHHNVSYTDNIMECVNYWQTFKEQIKWENRFIYNPAKFSELGWDRFFNDKVTLNAESILYRARINNDGSQKPIQKENMGSPPRENASGGRANPLGIPYLYLSEDMLTVLHEVRATYGDIVSVGKFKIAEVNSSLDIIDFTKTSSLFHADEKPDFIIKENLVKGAISKDLSKPKYRHDSEIEYIPTQFICEFIKYVIGASGLKFRSSLKITGSNYVIFEGEKMNCVSVSLVKISGLQIMYNKCD